MGEEKPKNPAVLSPGKVFLAGEYSVLDGGWALVSTMAVHARASLVERGTGLGPQSSLVEAILREMGATGLRLAPGRRIELDLSAFYDGPVKRGIGSSAAGTAAVAGLVNFLSRGSVGRRDTLAQRCCILHRRLQGGVGSGADAAACARGGVVRFRLPSTVQPVTLPEGAWLRAVALGVGQRTTPVLVRHADMVRRGDPTVMNNLEVFAEAADRIMDGILRNDFYSLRLGVSLASACYEELADILGAQLVTPQDRAAMKAARRHGGVSRPTGAGGGDLHLAYFPDPEAARAFGAWAGRQGFHSMPVIPDPRGTRVERIRRQG